MPPGLLWVSSRISDPSPSDASALTADKFCAWYEDTHIQQVTALPGIPRAARYEAIEPQPSDDAWSAHAPWLTVYDMDDVDVRRSEAFRGLDGQSEPEGELLQDVFERARFDTRIYVEVDAKSNRGTCRAPFLVSWGVDDVGSVDAKAVENVEGVLDVRRYEVIEGTTLERFVRRHGGAMKGLVLVEANEGATLPDTLSAIVGRDEKEIGWFRLKRVYR